MKGKDENRQDGKIIDQQLCRLFMRLYTGNRRGANEHRGFFVFILVVSGQ
jgi:hypothetical protein